MWPVGSWVRTRVLATADVFSRLFVTSISYAEPLCPLMRFPRLSLIAPNEALILTSEEDYKTPFPRALYFLSSRAIACSYWREMAIESEPESPPILRGLQNLQFELGSEMYTTSSFCLMTLGSAFPTWACSAGIYSFLKSASKSSDICDACKGTALACCFISLDAWTMRLFCAKHFYRNIFNYDC